MKKNILFILTDDQSYFAIGRKCREIKTPNLDVLCDEGVLYDNCFCASPVCSPARASILTGTMPSFHGVHDWIISGNVNINELPEFSAKRPPIRNNESVAIDYLDGITTYTDVLAENGYDIALSGKYHLGDTFKKRKGYTYWNVLLRGGCSYVSYDTYHDDKVEAHTKYVTDLIADNAIDFLQNKRSDKPFYLGVHFTAPHTPWDKEEHPKRIWDIYEGCEFDSVRYSPIHKDQVINSFIGDTEEKRKELIRGYFTAITAMDEAVGRIVAELKKQNLYENTVIIFTGDNGMNVGQHGVWGKGNGTYPQNFYEESVKVPLIISGGGIKNKTVDDMVSHVDLFPTILELCGVCGKADNLSGKSFAKTLVGESFDREYVSVFSEYGATRMIRSKRYKLIKSYIGREDIFYDLKEDPYEEKNCIDDEKYSCIIKEMTAMLSEGFKKYSDVSRDGKYQFPKGAGQAKLADNIDGNAAYKQNIRMYYDIERD